MKNTLLRVRILLPFGKAAQQNFRQRETAYHSYTQLLISFHHLTRYCLGVWRIKQDVIGFLLSYPLRTTELPSLQSSSPQQQMGSLSFQEEERRSRGMILNSEAEQGEVSPFQPFTSHYCAGLIPSHLTN